MAMAAADNNDLHKLAEKPVLNRWDAAVDLRGNFLDKLKLCIGFIFRTVLPVSLISCQAVQGQRHPAIDLAHGCGGYQRTAFQLADGKRCLQVYDCAALD